MAILLHVLGAWLVALVHAVLDEEESEEFGDADVLLNVVKDVEQVDGEAHGRQHVVVLADLCRVRHVNYDVFRDAWVVRDQVW